MIQERQARSAADLDAKCLRAWRRYGSFTEAARRLGVTSKFLRAAVERAEAAGVGLAGPRVRIHRPAPEPDVHASQAEERAWLKLVAQGADVPAVAELAGVGPERIVLGMQRARDAGLAWWEARRPFTPRVEVMIPFDYRPSSACPHHGPIAKGRKAYCVVCHASGLDGSPGMKIDPKTAPRPDPKAPEPIAGGKAEAKSRSKAQRRAEALERLKWLL